MNRYEYITTFQQYPHVNGWSNQAKFPIQGLCTLHLDSLTSIPLAFHMHPSKSQQTRPAVSPPCAAAARTPLQSSPTCSIFNLYPTLVWGFFSIASVGHQVFYMTLWLLLFYKALVGLSPMNYIHKRINLTEWKLDFDHLMTAVGHFCLQQSLCIKQQSYGLQGWVERSLT